MMYVVNYTRKPSFLKDARLKQTNNEGEVVLDKRYVKNTLPGSLRVYVPKIGRDNKMMVNLKQEELDTLVSEIGFYDSDNKVITTAPLRNPKGAFWLHPDLKITLSGSGTPLNDEIALDRFWLKCFEADPHFKASMEEIAPSKSSMVEYVVSKSSEESENAQKDHDETFEAMRLLTKHEDDPEKLISVLRAMGTVVKDVTNIKLVRNALLRKITEYKNQLSLANDGERNIDVFIRLMNSSTKELVIKDLISKALTSRIIVKNQHNQYVYGDIKIGTSKGAIEKFLEDEENKDILEEIREKVK